MIRVEDGYTDIGGESGTKGRKTRSVPMTADVREALLPFVQGRPLYDEHGMPTRLFVDRNGPLNYANLYARFLKAARIAGLPRITFHELRHSFGTNLAREGIDIVTIQTVMGHAGIGTTQKYMHYAPKPDLARLMGVALARAKAKVGVVTIERPKGGRPAKNPGGCPKCGEPKAKGQPYCREHMAEYKRERRAHGNQTQDPEIPAAA